MKPLFIYFVNIKLLSWSPLQPINLKNSVQAKALNNGTTKLSSTWKGGTRIPKTLFGMVSAGVGTARSAKAPDKPKNKEDFNNVEAGGITSAMDDHFAEDKIK
mmetsp:Transcript_10990/g.14344  ORF Transcript_10990/g.14344 Transcript_10990/m.14344 type:complete len:103 (+) Transcript_10990:217-525(+)